MQLSPNQRARLNSRLIEVFREVGTLLLAFAPLDYLQQERVDVATLAGFVLVGLACVGLAVIRELRGVR